MIGQQDNTKLMELWNACVFMNKKDYQGISVGDALAKLGDKAQEALQKQAPDGWTPLQLVAKNEKGGSDAIMEILAVLDDKAQEALQKPDPDGWTPLQRVAAKKEQDFSAATALILYILGDTAQAELQKRDPERMTPLERARSRGANSVILILLLENIYQHVIQGRLSSKLSSNQSKRLEHFKTFLGALANNDNDRLVEACETANKQFRKTSYVFFKGSQNYLDAITAIMKVVDISMPEQTEKACGLFVDLLRSRGVDLPIDVSKDKEDGEFIEVEKFDGQNFDL